MRALAGLLFFEAWDVTGPVVAAHTARSIPVELVVLAAGAQPISPFPRCHDGDPEVQQKMLNLKFPDRWRLSTWCLTSRSF